MTKISEFGTNVETQHRNYTNKKASSDSMRTPSIPMSLIAGLSMRLRCKASAAAAVWSVVHGASAKPVSESRLRENGVLYMQQVVQRAARRQLRAVEA